MHVRVEDNLRALIYMEQRDAGKRQHMDLALLLYETGRGSDHRVGSRNEPLTPRELRRLMFSRGEVSFERLACQNVRLEALDDKLINRYIHRHENYTGRPLNLSREEFLMNLGCATRWSDGVIPTNAGILLFHQEPQLYLLQSQLLCARFKGTREGYTLSDDYQTIPKQYIRTPLYSQSNEWHIYLQKKWN